MREFLDAYSKYCNLVRAAEAAGVTPRCHYKWKDESEGYRKAFERRKDVAADYLESVLADHGAEGWTEPIYYQGRKCGNVRRYDHSAIMFLLRGMRPEKYVAQRHEVSGPQGQPIQAKIEVIFVDPPNVTDSSR